MLDTDRVRTHTAEAVLRRIDDRTVRSVSEYAAADPGVISRRLDELDREWDSDRLIAAEASATGLAGLALGVLAAPALLGITAFAAGAVFVHALGGWYPPMPIFRRLGIRSGREIARERYALKALRGDFVAIGARPDAVMTAAAPSGNTSGGTEMSGPVGK